MSAVVRCAGLVLVAGLLAAGCRESVPDSHTSLTTNPGPDPGPPSRPLSLLWAQPPGFGEALLDGGLRAALRARGVTVHVLGASQAAGEHMNPAGWSATFNHPERLRALLGGGPGKDGRYDVVVFGSGPVVADIDDEDALDDYKQWYGSILPAMRARPDVLFVALSTPPLLKGETTRENAVRARRWAHFVTRDLVTGAPNLAAFDLYGALAVREGRYRGNTLVPQFAAGGSGSQPGPAGAAAVERLFVPFLDRVVRAARVAK